MRWCVCKKTDDLREAQKWGSEVMDAMLKEIGKFGNPIFNTNVYPPIVALWYETTEEELKRICEKYNLVVDQIVDEVSFLATKPE